MTSRIPTRLRLLRELLRHYPLNRPRMALLDRLPDVPADCGAFRVKDGLVGACYAGRDVISKSLFWLGDFDPWVGAALRRLARPGDTVLDIGANIGVTAMVLARKVGTRGRVICFEPFPPHAKKLRHNLRCNGLTNVTVHELALSSEPGRLKMGVPDWDNLGMARVVSRDGPAAGHEVAADTLDAFCRREGIDDIAVCKIDVEGHEADVLRGARRTLEAGAVRAFVFERAVTTSAAAEDEVVQLFHSNQYSVLQLHKRVLGMDAADCGCNGNHAVRGTSTLDFIALRRHTRAEELWAGLL